MCKNPNCFCSLPPGIINEEVIHLFTNGYCVQLANAIHQLTGWKIVGFFPNPGLTGKIRFHAAVVTPELEYVDIEGPGALKRWRDRESLEWDDHKISDLRPVAGCEEALLWARAVLDQHFRKLLPIPEITTRSTTRSVTNEAKPSQGELLKPV